MGAGADPRSPGGKHGLFDDGVVDVGLAGLGDGRVGVVEFEPVLRVALDRHDRVVGHLINSRSVDGLVLATHLVGRRRRGFRLRRRDLVGPGGPRILLPTDLVRRGRGRLGLGSGCLVDPVLGPGDRLGVVGRGLLRFGHPADTEPKEPSADDTEPIPRPEDGVDEAARAEAEAAASAADEVGGEEDPGTAGADEIASAEAEAAAAAADEVGGEDETVDAAAVDEVADDTVVAIESDPEHGLEFDDADAAITEAGEADVDNTVVEEAVLAAGAAQTAPAPTVPLETPAGGRARGTTPAPAPVAEPTIKIGDRASAIFVIATVLVFAVIFLNGVLLGKGGAFTPNPSPSPEPSASIAPSASVTPSASLVPSGSPSASGSAGPSGSVAPSGSVTPAASSSAPAASVSAAPS